MIKTAEVIQVIYALQSPERFKLLEDGWIQDAYLGLEWGASSNKYLTFKQALAYVKKHKGRLPEVHELHSLVDYSKENPSINPLFKDTKSSYYWTNTKFVNTSYTARWVVYFYCGVVFWSSENYDSCVRPVRPCQC